MTIVEHIQELRSRIIKALLGLLVGTILGYIWYQNGISLGRLRIPSLGDILLRPYCNLPEESRLGLPGTCRLLATSPFEMFLLRLKVGALAGMVLSSPVWLGQVWAFITPGLVRRERRVTLAVVSAAATLFVFGAVLAYFVLTYGLGFLMMMGNEVQTTALTGREYFGFAVGLIVVFGVSFELPLFIVMLNAVGVLKYEAVKDKRRGIILLLFIFAAFMTPGQEPASMVAMALSLCLMVEIALQICRLNDKRRAKARPDWLDLDDEQGSGPVTASGPVSASARPDATAPPAAPGAALDARPAGDFDDVL